VGFAGGWYCRAGPRAKSIEKTTPLLGDDGLALPLLGQDTAGVEPLEAPLCATVCPLDAAPLETPLCATVAPLEATEPADPLPLDSLRPLPAPATLGVVALLQPATRRARSAATPLMSLTCITCSRVWNRVDNEAIAFDGPSANGSHMQPHGTDSDVVVPALTSNGVPMGDVSSCFAPVVTDAAFKASIVGH